MASVRDKQGRPLVVVTGAGVVTSLGAGKEDNWRKLTAGESGIHAINRFPTEALKTSIAGTVDFIAADPMCAPVLSQRLAEMAVGEAISQAGIGKEFPGPLFIAVPPVEIEWEQRRALAQASGANGAVNYDDLLRASPKFGDYHDRFMFGSVADALADKFGTQGSPISLSTACASGATAIHLGLEAIRRGEADAALCAGTEGAVHGESLSGVQLV